MSTEMEPEEQMNLTELTELLIKFYGHKEGFFDLCINMKIATGSFGPSKEELLPGASFVISGVGLKRAENPGIRSVNAEEISRKPKTKAKSKG